MSILDRTATTDNASVTVTAAWGDEDDDQSLMDGLGLKHTQPWRLGAHADWDTLTRRAGGGVPQVRCLLLSFEVVLSVHRMINTVSGPFANKL